MVPRSVVGARLGAPRQPPPWEEGSCWWTYVDESGVSNFETCQSIGKIHQNLPRRRCPRLLVRSREWRGREGVDNWWDGEQCVQRKLLQTTIYSYCTLNFRRNNVRGSSQKSLPLTAPLQNLTAKHKQRDIRSHFHIYLQTHSHIVYVPSSWDGGRSVENKFS